MLPRQAGEGWGEGTDFESFDIKGSNNVAMQNEKDLDYYLNLNWTLIEGSDLGFEGEPYYYIEIKEIPSFTFCAKTIEKAREHYKTQLKLTLMVMLETDEKIVEPDEFEEEPDWESLCP